MPGARERAEAGKLAFGTVDSWLVWKLTERRDARHRRQQRVADDAVQHPHAAVGRRAAAAVRRPGEHAARGACVERGLRHACRPALGVGGGADCRHRRRSAGGALRADVRRAGPDEEHLRHRLLPAAEHRDAAGRVGEPAGDDRRLADRRTHRVRARGQRLHRRRGGAVAARRARPDRASPPDVEPLAASVAGQRRRLPGAGVRRPRRAALGSVRARHDRRHHARHDRRAHRARGAREHRVSGRRPARRGARDAGIPLERTARRRRRRRPTTC